MFSTALALWFLLKVLLGSRYFASKLHVCLRVMHKQERDIVYIQYKPAFLKPFFLRPKIAKNNYLQM